MLRLITVLFVLLVHCHAIELDESHPELMDLAQKIGERRRGLIWPNEFTQDDKDDILALHNKIRAETARGEYLAATSSGDGTGKMPKANNMVKLKWSDQLADVASEWAGELCDGALRHRDNEPNYPNCQEALSAFPSHDFPWAGDGCGENAHGSTYNWATWSTNKKGQLSGVKPGIENSMSKFESQAFTPATNFKYNGAGQKCSRSYCAHYTAIVWAETRYVGCGWVSCSTTSNKYKLVCNYYPSGNVGGKVIYGTGGNIGSQCPSGYTKSSASSSYQDQDGEIYNLGKLCVADDTSTTIYDNPNVNGGGGDTSSSECCSGCTSKKECSASSWCTNKVCSQDNWCCASGWDNQCVSVANNHCGSDTSSNGGGGSDDTPCVQVSGWGDSKFAGNVDFDYGQWIQDSNTPIDNNGYIVYKHTHSDYYLYTLPGYKEYTFSTKVDTTSYIKGWCAATTDDVTQCSGKWHQASNVKFYNCGSQPFIAEPCFDDAAELVRFMLDENESDEYMQFDLHSDVGCLNEQPVWLLEDENEGENATLHFLHYNVGSARGVGAWQITADNIEGGDLVYWCDEEALSDCTAGAWKELNVTTSEAGSSLGENVLASATVTLGASAEDKAGLSETDDVAIAIVALLVVCVVGVVALLWCRARRNKGQVEVGFEDADEIEVEQMQTETGAEDNTTR